MPGTAILDLGPRRPRGFALGASLDLTPTRSALTLRLLEGRRRVDMTSPVRPLAHTLAGTERHRVAIRG